MQNNSHFPVRLDTLSKGSIACLLTVYLGSFCVALIAGMEGPEPFDIQTSIMTLNVAFNDTTSNEDEYSKIIISNLNSWNQFLYVQAFVQKPGWNDPTFEELKEFEFEEIMTINVQGYEKKFAQVCADLDLKNKVAAVEHQIAGLGIEDISAICAKMSPEQLNPDVIMAEGTVHKRTIRCKQNEEYCEPTHLLYRHFIDHETYKINVNFQHKGVLYNKDPVLASDASIKFKTFSMSQVYTKFQVGWKYFFFFVSVFVATWFFCKLGAIDMKQWSLQQKWVVALLGALMLYNDPFFVIAIDNHNTVTTNEVFTGFYLLSVVAFLCLLFLFWQEIFEAVQESSASHRALGLGGRPQQITAKGEARKSLRERSFFGCRLLLFSIFCLCITILLFSQRMHQDGDPAYSSKADMQHFAALFGVIAFVMAVWFLNILRLVFLCFVDMRRGQNTTATFFLFWLTLSVILTAVVGVFANVMGPVRSAGMAFIGYHTIFNVYVYILAYCYAPSAWEGGDGGSAGGSLGAHQQLGSPQQLGSSAPGLEMAAYSRGGGGEREEMPDFGGSDDEQEREEAKEDDFDDGIVQADQVVLKVSEDTI